MVCCRGGKFVVFTNQPNRGELGSDVIPCRCTACGRSLVYSASCFPASSVSDWIGVTVGGNENVASHYHFTSHRQFSCKHSNTSEQRVLGDITNLS